MTAPRWLRPAVDYGPLAVFFAAYAAEGLMTATAVLMGATLLGLGVAVVLERRVPVMPLVTAAVVAVFGGLTLWLDDAAFIKMKPTVVFVLFAAVLGGGALIGRQPLRLLMGEAMPPLPDAAWRVLTLRYAGFFLVMAGLNEAVWRTQTTDLWVTFKVFGVIVLTLAFVFSQMPYILRRRLDEAEGAS